MSHSQISEMLLGALVADAASLGLHWLYDADRIAQVTESRGGQCAFTPIDPAHYQDVKGYFAHGARLNGALTQYGEVLRLTIRSMIAKEGNFDVATYQSEFAAHFGPGGTYQGYIDRPTRGALENIAREKAVSGIDDDQLPAIARLPAIAARYQRDADVQHVIAQAMQVTNVNDIAEAYSAVFADVLGQIMDGTPLLDSLNSAAARADGSIQAELRDALSTPETDSTVYAGLVGRACHLPTAGPVMFHILNRSNSYSEAVDKNILAGGDSAGRSILLGAIMGCIHGVAKPDGIPLDWILNVKDAAEIWEECCQFDQYCAQPTAS